MNIQSKLPNVGTNIFTIMSGLATEVGAINLSQGFPNFDPADKLQRLVFQAMQTGQNQYAPMPGLPALNEAIAEKIRITMELELSPQNEITVTAGATQAIFTIIAAFVHPGDEVIILEPCYDSYRPSIETVGGIAVPFQLKAPNYAIDWAAIKDLISPKTKMIITNTPNNPTGKVFIEADMEALAAMLDGTDILLLSDEVYEHLVYDGKKHHSALRYAKLRPRTLATFSFGKTFHNTGWKMGYVIAPAELTAEFRKVHQFNVFSCNRPTQQGLAQFMADPEEYLHLPDFYQKKRDIFAKAMEKSRFTAVPCEGTYFALYDFSAISDLSDFDFAQWLARTHGVASIPVSSFFSNGQDDKVVRFCFAKTGDLLLEAAAKLCLV